jgi:hypothetical protein
MFRKITTAAVFAVALGLAACSVQTPLSPAAPSGAGGRGTDGSTLKVGAPTPVSPINSALIQSTQTVTLTVQQPQVTFAGQQQPFVYEWELQDDAGSVINQTTTQNVTSAVFPGVFTAGGAYRWRSRVSIGNAIGPYSSVARFTVPNLRTPTAADSDNVWRDWFGGTPFGSGGLLVLRGVGSTMSVQALIALDPDLKAAGVLQETNSAQQPRGRLYLPTGSSSNLYGRTVDLGNFGGPWQWLSRGFSTCEGGSCR